MFAIRLRVRPWSARSGPRSVERVTVTVPSSSAICIRSETAWASSPRGPLTVTRPGPSETVTPSGTSIGCLPIRLISQSPNVGDDLAANTLRVRLVSGHHPGRGRDDRRAHAALDPRHLGAAHIVAAARARDAAHTADHRPPVLGVLELDPDHLADGGGLDLVTGDVALLGEDPADLLLQARGRNLHRGMVGGQSVADPGQVIGYRVGKHREVVDRWLGRVTSWTCSSPGRSPGGPARAGRAGRGRTCGSRPAGGRTCGSGCRPASCTWACAAGARSVTSSPSTPRNSRRSGLARLPRPRPLRLPRPPRRGPASRRPRGSLPSTARGPPARPLRGRAPPRGGAAPLRRPRARRRPDGPRRQTAFLARA